MLPVPAPPVPYTGPGFHFRHPSNWLVEEEPQDNELTVTVRPEGEEGTAFWSLTTLYARPKTQTVLRSVLRAFEEEYDEVDTYPAEQSISGQKAVGRDVEFVCVELLNTARVRVFRTRDFTAVVMWQATDEELKEYDEVFRVLTGSLQCGWEPEADDEEE